MTGYKAPEADHSDEENNMEVSKHDKQHGAG